MSRVQQSCPFACSLSEVRLLQLAERGGAERKEIEGQEEEIVVASARVRPLPAGGRCRRHGGQAWADASRVGRAGDRPIAASTGAACCAPTAVRHGREVLRPRSGALPTCRAARIYLARDETGSFATEGGLFEQLVFFRPRCCADLRCTITKTLLFDKAVRLAPFRLDRSARARGGSRSDRQAFSLCGDEGGAARSRAPLPMCVCIRWTISGGSAIGNQRGQRCEV